MLSLGALDFTPSTSNNVNHGSASTLDDLGPFTWIAWVRFDTWTAGNGWLIMKSTGVGSDQKRIRTFTDSSFVLTISGTTARPIALPSHTDP
jgi:hypothetical protein